MSAESDNKGQEIDEIGRRIESLIHASDVHIDEKIEILKKVLEIIENDQQAEENA